MGTTAGLRSVPGNQDENVGHRLSGSKVRRIGVIRTEAEPPKLEDLTRPASPRPFRVLGWFRRVGLVLERLGTLRGGSAEIDLTGSVGVMSASGSESSGSVKGADPQ